MKVNAKIIAFKQRKALSSPRTIQTVYHLDKDVVQINKSSYANSAVIRCVDHLQLNHYGATIAEIYDTASGVLHAVIRRTISGDINIIYKREVKEGM